MVPGLWTGWHEVSLEWRQKLDKKGCIGNLRCLPWVQISSLTKLSFSSLDPLVHDLPQIQTTYVQHHDLYYVHFR